jgi:hypothetical protein
MIDATQALLQGDYAYTLIYLSRAPNLRRMRYAEYEYTEFQSLDATDCLPRGSTRSVHVEGAGEYFQNGYIERRP